MAVLNPGALNDPGRLAALRRLGLDNGDTTAFDRLARLAAEYLQVPQAMVSIVEDERQVFAGLAVSGQSDPPYAARDAPIRYSYCQYVVDRGQPLIVSDARQDPMLCTHPALLELGAVCYIGVPIALPDGHVLGSFCAVDTEPRQWTDAQVAFLTDLTASVVTEIELRHELDQRAELEARHAAAEAHYRRLATGIPQGVYVLNAEGRFTEVNESAERILERSADELIGQTLGLVISERNERPVGQIFHEVISGKSDDVEFETWITRPSGEDRLLLVTASAIDGDGRITGLHGIARDITDERAAEAAVRESELRLRQILDALPIGAVLAEPPGRLVWHNPAADRIWGGLQPASPEAYEHYRGYESETGREIEPKEWPLARALLGEVVEGVLLDIDTFDGRRCTTLNSAVPLHSETGEITAAIAIMEDVTDARAHDAEQRLLAAALEGLSEGICLVTPEGVIIYANETFTTVLGIDPDRVPGVRFADFADSPEVEAEQQDHLRLAMENGRWSGRVRRPRLSDGVEIPIDLVLGRVEHDGDTRLLFGIAQDATVEIEREQHLRRAERLASVGTMIGGVAHELNNPLQAILNYAQLLLLDERSPEDRDALGTMEREAQRMAKIVADLKQIARSTQEVSDTSASADLNDVVRHVMTVQEYSLRTSNIEVRLDLGTDLPPILVDRGQLEQVLVNL
ncbi:MAG: PAS domain S-box protein, partial [Gemmatimonadetes bacterium]|nr:PAS domain S-box protein [Gemmatimonadota bacterium]